VGNPRLVGKLGGGEGGKKKGSLSKGHIGGVKEE